MGRSWVTIRIAAAIAQSEKIIKNIPWLTSLKALSEPMTRPMSHPLAATPTAIIATLIDGGEGRSAAYTVSASVTQAM